MKLSFVESNQHNQNYYLEKVKLKLLHSEEAKQSLIDLLHLEVSFEVKAKPNHKKFQPQTRGLNRTIIPLVEGI